MLLVPGGHLSGHLHSGVTCVMPVALPVTHPLPLGCAHTSHLWWCRSSSQSCGVACACFCGRCLGVDAIARSYSCPWRVLLALFLVGWSGLQWCSRSPVVLGQVLSFAHPLWGRGVGASSHAVCRSG